MTLVITQGHQTSHGDFFKVTTASTQKSVEEFTAYSIAVFSSLLTVTYATNDRGA